MLVPAGFPLNGAAALCVTLGFQGGEVVLGVSAAGGGRPGYSTASDGLILPRR
jgi:hypothetical protein